AGGGVGPELGRLAALAAFAARSPPSSAPFSDGARRSRRGILFPLLRSACAARVSAVVHGGRACTIFRSGGILPYGGRNAGYAAVIRLRRRGFGADGGSTGAGEGARVKFTIRNEQKDAFAESAGRQFERSAVQHLRTEMSAQVKTFSDEQLRAW